MEAHAPYRYEQLADLIVGMIDKGALSPGMRVPSVRTVSEQHQLSIATALQAYRMLEDRGILVSRPQSGFYVSNARHATFALPSTSRPPTKPSTVSISGAVAVLLEHASNMSLVPLGCAVPDVGLLQSKRLDLMLARVARQHGPRHNVYSPPRGEAALRREIARRSMRTGHALSPDDILITSGCTEALTLALGAVAKPGDTIAVESPAFYAMLLAVERLGMKVVEVSTDPYDGIRIEALADIMARQPIAAVMVMPNFQNPLGFQMSDQRKRALVQLLEQHDVPAIENGVYNELYYGDAHPSSLKSYDRKGLVLHCASFSKSLSAAQRVGWALAGRYRGKVEELKFLNTLTTSSFPQLAIAAYLQNDGYEQHLRRIRKAYAQQARIMAAAVQRFFPAGTKISQPQGGYVLWVELPGNVDSMQLYRRALECRITVGPGRMFCVSHAYKHCIRLNYSYPWSAGVEQAIVLLGKLITEFL